MKAVREKQGPFDVRLWSGGSGPPLLYLHGFEQHPGAAPFLAKLAESRAVRAPEHPGYGSSSGFEAIEDIFDVTLHYRRLVESWNLGPVDVVGHSLGGMFAAELAAVAPHLVRRLVLVSPYAGFPHRRARGAAREPGMELFHPGCPAERTPSPSTEDAEGLIPCPSPWK